jgi:hypothetical protein
MSRSDCLRTQTPGAAGAKEEDRLAVDRHTLQVDLASRSKYGKVIETGSGHFMAAEVPENIVDPIRDVIGQVRALKQETPKE